MMRKEKIKGLNRKIFYRNLKANLKEKYAKELKYTFESWVEDYETHCQVSESYGWYEIKASESKVGFSQEIRTN